MSLTHLLRNLMTRMLNANLNLMSRMGNWLDFPDYDDGELLEISSLLSKTYGTIASVTSSLLEKSGFQAGHLYPIIGYKYTDAAKAKFTEFMNIRKEFPYFSNARTVRNCMERARRVAATRILKDALDNGTTVRRLHSQHIPNLRS